MERDAVEVPLHVPVLGRGERGSRRSRRCGGIFNGLRKEAAEDHLGPRIFLVEHPPRGAEKLRVAIRVPVELEKVTMFSSFQISQRRIGRKGTALGFPSRTTRRARSGRTASRRKVVQAQSSKGAVHRLFDGPGASTSSARAPDEGEDHGPMFGREPDLPVEPVEVRVGDEAASAPWSPTQNIASLALVILAEALHQREVGVAALLPVGRFRGSTTGGQAFGRGGGGNQQERALGRALVHDVSEIIAAPFGAWRSLVARTVRVGEVPGSNPGAPTA